MSICHLPRKGLLAELAAVQIAATEKSAQIRRIRNFIVACWTAGNQYLDRCAPWNDTDDTRVACVLRTAINLARIEAIVSSPFVPDASERLAADLGLSDGERAWPDGATEALGVLQPGRPLRIGEPLFPRIGDRSTLAAWVAEMESRFGGREDAA